MNCIYGWKAVSKTAALSKGIQTVFLSGGIPHSAFNAFGIAHLTKEAISGHPIIGMKNMVRSFSEKAARNHELANIKYIKLMQSGEGAVPYRGTLDTKALTSVGDRIAEAQGYTGKTKAALGEVWNKAMEDGTFRRYLPGIQLDTFKGIYLREIKKGVPKDKAVRIAQDAVKNSFGLNSLATDAVRNRVANDAISTAFFAPKFRESMFNFWADNAKAVGNPKNWSKPEYRENLRFMAGATLLFGAMEAANTALNGKPTWENDNPNDKFSLSIPTKDGHSIAVPFLSSIATVPRTAIGAGIDIAQGDFKAAGLEGKKFLSQLVRPAADLATNQKYNGRQIYNENDTSGEKFKDAAVYTAGQYNHPWVSAGLNAATGKSSGPLETIATATEAPLRFRNYDSSQYNSKNAKSYDDLVAGIKSSYGGKFAKMSNSELEELAKTDADAKDYMDKIEGVKRVTKTADDLPSNINNDARKILDTHTKLSDDGRKKWGGRASSNTNANNEMLSWLPQGVQPPQITNEITKKWADYKKKEAEGSLANLEAEKERKSIMRSAYNSVLNEDEKDLYSLSKEKLQSAYDRGLINDENISKALAVEKQLYDAGLIDKESLARKLNQGGRGYKTAGGSRGSRGRGGKGKQPPIALLMKANTPVNIGKPSQSKLAKAKIPSIPNFAVKTPKVAKKSTKTNKSKITVSKTNIA